MARKYQSAGMKYLQEQKNKKEQKEKDRKITIQNQRLPSLHRDTGDDVIDKGRPTGNPIWDKWQAIRNKGITDVIETETDKFEALGRLNVAKTLHDNRDITQRTIVQSLISEEQDGVRDEVLSEQRYKTELADLKKTRAQTQQRYST